jgi:hypothetical protein
VKFIVELRRVFMELRDQRLLETFGRGQITISDDPVFRPEAGTIPDVWGNLVQRHSFRCSSAPAIGGLGSTTSGTRLEAC